MAIRRVRAVTLTLVFALISLAVPWSQTIPQDTGAAGAWGKILKVKTTASVMHTTAHPDDEHGGVITRLSRLDGARLALTTLNRGESGDNAIGPQLFDALGLIRTEELIDAGRYYGVDNQYFTTVIDYGFSKRLEEAFDKWGRDNVLRDLVRIIRMDRPWVLLSRFQGNSRDGHGNHQTAGLLTQLAFKAAGDPQQFPEQIAEGLRPWQPFKVYMGGVRENEDWTVRIDSGEYSPWLGDSYDNVARYGLSFQRSQNSGRYSPSAGANFGYYKRVGERIPSPAKEAWIWDGIDTTYAGLFKTLGRTAPADVDLQLAAIDRAVARAMRDFTMTDPSKAAPGLVEGLTLVREVMAKSAQEPEVLHTLRVKEQQFQAAITASLGLELTALAQPANTPDPAGPAAAFAPPALMSAPVPGQRFEVRARFANRGGTSVSLGSAIAIETAPGWSSSALPGPMPALIARHEVVTARFAVTSADDVPLSTRPYFSRTGLAESRYTVSDPKQFGRPASPAPLVAVARYTIEGVPVEIRETVRRREAKLPYGDVLREVRSVPRLALSVTPSSAIVPVSASGSINKSTDQSATHVDLEVSLLHNAESATSGHVTLRMPAGWTSEPASQTFSFARSGERASVKFSVRPASVGEQRYRLEAVATAAGKEYREGYDVIDQRDLEVRYLYRGATTEVRGISVATVPGLKVGYVMGIGDQVPLGLQQLGAQVTLLGERELATADLSVYDTIMTGTRAYAVREDLRTYNQRLLDYVKAGGNMIVLYNTQEFVPAQFAPFPGELPRSAEEVSEEDSPVEILAPNQQAFTWPNRITLADFEGWVEQRGSKFFTTWDAAYTPMIATYDKGQPPQRGGWLTAKYGNGTWTYFAYALHRQLPYSVPGAYRITANLLALSQTQR
jgi:LmbE family N-acetylglucosaminyl deacetylase